MTRWSLAKIVFILFLLCFPLSVPSGIWAQGSTQPELRLVEPRFVLIPASARPGETVTVAYSANFRNSPTGLQAVLVDSGGKRLTKSAFFGLQAEEGEPELKTAILAIPSTAAFGNAVVRIESGDGIIRDLPYVITSRDFFTETISLNQENTDLRTVPDPKKTAEAQQLWAIISRTGTEIYSGAAFLPPVTSTRRTGNYGDRRTYSYIDGTSDRSIHAGVDYGVPTGTEVRACARGKVVMVRNRIVTGNSVVLEHLPGLYSLYYHLDRINVSEGTHVEAGSIIGLSGATGLATGPHLHWEIRVSGEYADPDIFLARPVLDKKDIFNRMMTEE